MDDVQVYDRQQLQRKATLEARTTVGKSLLCVDRGLGLSVGPIHFYPTLSIAFAYVRQEKKERKGEYD